MGYAEIALPLAALGVPTTPVKPMSKAAFMSGWQDSATIDVEQIKKWDLQYPNHNGAAVAKADLSAVWFFEVDSPDVAQRIETETGNKLPETYRVRSRPGRGHYYFRQTPASIAMGNISQAFVKNKDWSARVHNEYVVAAGSIHPETGVPYTSLREEPINPAPDWLVEWCLSQKMTSSAQKTLAASSEPIPEGGRNNWLTSMAGKMRHATGADLDTLTVFLLALNQQRCIPPLPEDEVKTIAASISRYAINTDPPVYSNGKLINGPSGYPQGTLQQPAQIAQQTEIVLPTYKKSSHPRFPYDVMDGTSVYENFVKPVCTVNSRCPEFMWLPAVQIMLNYLTLKVQVKDKDWKGNMYSVLIGKKGMIKSSSVNDAITFMGKVGIVDHGGMDTASAAGKVLVWTAGSPEGFGLDMQRTNCKNGILFYDELSGLVKKAGIEASGMISALNIMYESGKFSNSVKGRKESYGLAPNSYAASLITCDTDRNFQTHWSTLSGESTGLNDRFFFLYQPEKLPEPVPYTYVNTDLSSGMTQHLIEKAVQQGKYEFFDQSPLRRLYAIDNRYGHRAEKFALYFAVDLDRSDIDEDCVERACRLVDYEIAVKKYLKTYEAVTKEGTYQQELIYFLRNNGGSATMHEVEKKMKPKRFGTGLWYSIFQGLVKSGRVRVIGQGTQGDPQVVQLLRDEDDDD
jgi:hypothetical protein